MGGSKSQKKGASKTLKKFNPRVFVLAIPIALIGMILVSTYNLAIKTEGKLANVIADFGLSDQEQNLKGYLKAANAHHYYDIAERVKWCLDTKVPTSHECVMDDGQTVKDALEARIGMGN